MERLTFEGNFCDIAQCSELPCKYDGNCTQKQVWERLKAYEDAGLSPQACAEAREIEETLSGYDYSISRMVELMKADVEGRVLILPCKAGEHIFVVGSQKIVECKVDAIYQDAREPVVCCTFDCDSDCSGCPFYAPLPDPEGDFRCAGELREAEIGFAKFGKTVFLTKEEAEKALQEMEGKKDG